MLLLLQRRGRVTAREVADELEVSERTARRDLEALAYAGIPVFSQQGKGGGWRLAGGGRTDLSGLSAGEARALFLVAGPAAATPEVRAALRKLVRALPEQLRDEAEQAAGAVVVDRGGWGRRALERPAPPLFDAAQDAVIRGRRIRLGYVDREGKSTTRLVDPLGLVTKAATWYLVGTTDAGLRTFRVDRITDVEQTGEPVARPEGFDLEQTWRAVVDEVEERRTPVRARLLIDPPMVAILRSLFGQRLHIGPTDEASGRVVTEVRGHSLRSLAAELGGFGSMAIVADPPELREELARLGRELVGLYPS